MKNSSKYIFFLLAFPPNLFAYIDPGSGGALVTAILGFFAAIGYTLRKYFYKLKKIFTKNK